MATLNKSEALFHKYRFVIAFDVLNGKAVFLISGLNDIPDFLFEEIEYQLDKRDLKGGLTYRPFNKYVGEPRISDEHPAIRIFGKSKAKEPYLLNGDYEGKSFDLDFLESLTTDQLSKLEEIYERELETFKCFHVWYNMKARDKFKSDIPIPMKHRLKFCKSMYNLVLDQQISEAQFKKSALDQPGVGAKGVKILWDWVEEIRPLIKIEDFLTGGTTDFVHSQMLSNFNETEGFSIRSTEPSRIDEILYKPLEIKKRKHKKRVEEKLDEQPKVSVELETQSSNEIDESSSNISEEKKGGFGKVIFWIIAIIIVAVWKWDEIMGYLN